jgi:ubiquinone/menaquinone biosynthesis C-methylase UbiE
MTTVALQVQEMETLSRCLLCRGTRIQSVDSDYNLCQCEACGYVFDNPRPSLAAIIKFYSSPEKYSSWIEAESSREQLWKRRLVKLLRHGVRGSLLDVGTGTGQFLNLARSHFSQVSGTEVSQTAVTIAKEKYGLDLWPRQVEDSNLPVDSFDTITLFHVLEHVPDPNQTIARCKELLKTGGVLLICVPNDVQAWTSKLKKAGKRLGFRAFQKFSPRLGIPRVFSSNEIHLSHFVPSVLTRFLEQAGFTILEESLDPYYATTGFKQLLHAAYFAFHRMFFEVTRMNRYDTVWIVAKKSGSRAYFGNERPGESKFDHSV